jgi:hypothetical protein
MLPAWDPKERNVGDHEPASHLTAIVWFMAYGDSGERWVSEYDYPSRTVTLTVATKGGGGSHQAVRKDESLSDPGGDFDVYVACEEEVGRVVKVLVRLDEFGALKNPHPDFNDTAVGSLTIYPYKPYGERAGMAHWIHWSHGPVFPEGGPRTWAEAMPKDEAIRRAERHREQSDMGRREP